MDKPLSYKLLTYINHILPKLHYKFSYKILRDTFIKLDYGNYELTTLRKEFFLLKKNGQIEFKSHYRKLVPILTQKGKLEIKTHLPFKQYGAWDGKWRLIIFDIPEEERENRTLLRNKLHELGFNQIRRSNYLSPYPLLGTMSRFSTDLGICQYLNFLTVEKIEDEKKIIGKIWNLSQINQKYKNFIKNSKKIEKNLLWPLKAKKIEQEFLTIYGLDPNLPSEFLPDDWQSQSAYRLFKAISNSY